MNSPIEVNLCDEESRVLMFQAMAAGLEIASQDEAHSIWADAQAGCTLTQCGWVNRDDWRVPGTDWRM